MKSISGASAAIFLIVMLIAAYFAIAKMPLNIQDYLAVTMIIAPIILGMRWLAERGSKDKPPEKPASRGVDE